MVERVGPFGDSMEMMGNSQDTYLGSQGTDSSASGSQTEPTSKKVDDHVDISQEEADENYEALGFLVEENEATQSMNILRVKYPEAFTEESERAVAEVLGDINLGHELSAFQETAVNGLLNGLDVICIVPTGAGKMLVPVVSKSNY